MLTTLRLLPNLVNPGYWKKLFGEISLVWKLMYDKEVPLYLKILPFVVAIYLLSPLDLIPGFLPVIGQLDDFGLLLVTLSTFIRLAPDEVVKQYLPASTNS
ncbi:MAG: DUF1232 domain-containing protein [Anaerolineales bacterium]|nr:DUF1232 domain-containing protein [Anaerolineales bacterium]MCB0012910.1 DUF1232 domain-containing protein [Anaerolineales bacterium]